MDVKSIALAASLLILSACGGGGGEDSVPIIPVTQAALDGSWSAGCRRDRDGDMREEFTTISGSSFSITSNIWVRAVDCSGIPEASTNISGTFSLGSEVTVLLNGSSVTATKNDIVVTTALYTLYTADFVTWANTNGTGLCGATDWVVGTAKEVVGTDCMSASFKDIMYIDDTVDPDLMYDGIDQEEGGTLDANGYPTVLDTDNVKAKLPGYTVSGTITLPDSVIGKQWYVAIDDDHDGSNGEITYTVGVITGSTFNYSLYDVPSGDYFIYGEVDMTGTLGPWNPGDYVGDGCGTTDSPCKVTIDSSKTVDFTLVVTLSLTVIGESGNQVTLDGSWSSGCWLDSDGDMSEEFTTISGSSFSITNNNWAGEGDCSGSADMIFNISGTFALGDEVTVQMNGSPVTATKNDYVVTVALLTIFDAGAVAWANTTGLCGATDWVVGTAKEVVGTDCMSTSFKDIMYIDDTVDPDLMYDGIDQEEGGTLDANGYPTVVDVDSAQARLSGLTTPDMALLLDGVDDKAEALASILPNTTTAQSFTVEAWIYPTAAGSYIATDDAYNLILFYDATEVNNGVGIKFILSSDCSTLVSATEFRDVTLNQWNHVAAMFDASAQQFTISINGILSSSPVSFTAGTFCSDPTEQFTVGGYYWRNDGTFQGSIDEVRVSDNVRYNTDFTPLDSFIPDTNTKGLWHFDESPGSTSFSDSSGNGNTLTGLNGAQTN